MPKPPPVALTGIRDILVGLTEEGRGDETASALGIGLSLAGMAGAHLTVQSAARRLTVVGGSGWGFVNDLIAQENRRLSARARAIAERAATDATLEGVSCSIEASGLAYPELVGRLTARARLADLTILDAEAREVDLDRDVIDGVLFGSGRPLLVVPPGGDTFSARRIVIAWDGSARAARAANDALPFLRAAEAVEIVSVVGEKDLSTSVAGAEFAPHLARHGVNVSVTNVPVDGDAAETLRRQAGLLGAEMLVIGAYRHSRLKEWFLGGVTHALLTRCPVPLFLAH
ncbi:universal stress protein [Methylorubrum extorquens]|uniref:universal stress protein n=1 Tax=Methylorubrum extorquens TaxID=408 RepID=UPI00015903AE|nr:universal stress protein [Methylorubrum extorquens]ABY31889.1 UspA domain protein [Methylorubrum extorquens PA1]KQP87151.1 universal stress protein UspA [Methylobacterium sp. Leaf119]WIU38507.1 universal stress protein [Methylorubrum extorquens]